MFEKRPGPIEIVGGLLFGLFPSVTEVGLVEGLLPMLIYNT